MEEKDKANVPGTNDENKVTPGESISKLRSGKAPLQEVLVVRNWKEYMGESLLIIFSVVLALILTEIFTKIHEDSQTHTVLHQLRAELIDNKRLETEQYAYHQKALKNIDSALTHPEFAKQFIYNGEISLQGIVPQGVLNHDLNSVAWEVAPSWRKVCRESSINRYECTKMLYER